MIPTRQDAPPKAANRTDARSASGESKLWKTFFSGVAVLTCSTILVKILGLFYKIPMLRYLGSVGMGYFNAAYEWYAILCVLSTTGLPVAMSMMIAKEQVAPKSFDSRVRAIHRVEKFSMRVFTLFGVVGSVLLYLCAGVISRLIDSPLTVYALQAVAPTLFFSCISAAYRGYYQGFQNMIPTAISQLIEAVGKLVFGLLFAHLATKAGMGEAQIAAFAMIGLSLGVAIACGYLFVYRMLHHPEREMLCENSNTASDVPQIANFQQPLGRRLLAIALPVTLSSSVLSLTKIVDMAMILRRLQGIGYTTEQANSLYGIYTTMAIPIFNLVPALLTSVSLSLIPTLTSQVASGDRVAQGQTVQAALRVTALLSIPASLALAIYSRPVLSLLFGASEVELLQAAPMLSLLAFSVIFSGLITTTNAALQAYGYPRVPIWSMLIGATVKLISAALLISVPRLNILGAPLSTLLCNGVIVGINLFVIYQRTGEEISIKKTLMHPLAISLPAVGLPAACVAYLSRCGWNEKALFIVAVPITLLLLALLCRIDGGANTNLLQEISTAKLKGLMHRIPLLRRLSSQKH